MFSHYFNSGNPDSYYICSEISCNSLLNLESDFTIEGWYYANSLDNCNGIFALCNGSGHANCSSLIRLGIDGTGNNLFLCYRETCAIPYLDFKFSVPSSIQTGVWNHFALQRCSNNQITLFDNGVRILNCTDTQSRAFCNLENFYIGNFQDGTGENSLNTSFNGYISNLRVVKNQNIYNINCEYVQVPNAALTNSGYGNCNNITGNIKFLFLTGFNQPSPCLQNINGNPTGTTFSPWGTLYSGILICSGGYNSITLPNTKKVINGYTGCYADGLGGSYSSIIYCNSGYIFDVNFNYDYISDGSGSYIINETSTRNCLNVKIDWDFSQKSKLFLDFQNLCATGSDIILNYTNDSYLFYEINSTCDTSIYLDEVLNCKSMNIDLIKKPFLYLRNIGCCNLYLNSSLVSGFNFFDQNKIIYKNNFINSNFLIKPKDGLFLTVQSSNDGSLYYFNGYYHFGFFYEFLNVKSVNTLGFYPSCCYFNYENQSYIPIYTYEDICNPLIDSISIPVTGYLESCKSIISMGRDFLVDSGVNLNISLCKNYYFNNNLIENKIQTGFNIISNFLYNCYDSCIKINAIVLQDGDIKYDLSKKNYNKNINSDQSILIEYDVDVTNTKNYSVLYYDCNSGNPDYELSLITVDTFNNNLSKCYNRSGIQQNTGLFNIREKDLALISINLCNNSSIRDLINKDVNATDLYLPTLQDFCYTYFYNLNRSNCNNNIFGNLICDTTCITSISPIINCSFILNCCLPEYENRKAEIYNICIESSDNRKSLLDIQNNENSENSDSFLIKNFNFTNNFNYCGLNFEYYPVASIFYQCNCYNIDFEYIDFCFILNGICKNICFPKNAINYDKLIINNSIEIFDILEKSTAKISYINNSKNIYFNLTNCCENYFTYDFPILKDKYGCFLYPDVFINNTINQKIQNNISFKINPSKCFINDNSYGLNNFLSFITSEMNGGIASKFKSGYNIYCCEDLTDLVNQLPICGCYTFTNLSNSCNYIYNNYCDFVNEISGFYTTGQYSGKCYNLFKLDWIGNDPFTSVNYASGYYSIFCECSPTYLYSDYPYNSTEYNFLMMDIIDEITTCKYEIPSGNWHEILNSISLYNQDNSIINYKNLNGSGYNYILPISNNLIYSDLINISGGNSGFYSNQINKNLNFLNTGFSYNTYISNITGESGCYLSIINNQDHYLNINLLNNNYSINIPNQSLFFNGLCRKFSISKCYTFSGIQPICIDSNYRLLNIEYPIICTNLSLYCDGSTDDASSGIYYYVYDINNYQKKPVKIISPDLTFINFICWNDQSGAKALNLNSDYCTISNLGQIKNNVARLNLEIDKCINNNTYYINPNNFICFCINILGGL